MCNQYVLKGKLRITLGHIRPSYRNFFQPIAAGCFLEFVSQRIEMKIELLDLKPKMSDFRADVLKGYQRNRSISSPCIL